MTQSPALPEPASGDLAPTNVSTGSTIESGTFAALRLPNFRLLIVGTTLSNAATWIQQVTLGWVVYDLTDSGTMLGSVNLVRSVASVGLAPMASIAIDRFARRILMLVTALWMLVTSGTLGLAMLSSDAELWWLFAYTFVGGAAQALDYPLRQTVVFTLVPRAIAPNAVALVQTGWALMRSIGPAVGGVLILWFGPGGNFLVMAAAYVVIALTVMRLRFPADASGGKSGPVRGMLREGIRYLAADRTSRAFVMMGWVLPFLIIPNYAALPPIFARDVFQGGPEVLGLLISSVGIGGIVGGVIAASLGKLERRGLVQLGALFLNGASLIGFAMSPTLLTALPLYALSGVFEMIYLTTNQTLLQLSIPDSLRGRVMGIVALNAGLSPVGGVVAGFGSDLIGPRAVTIILSSMAGVLAIVVYLFSPTIREYRLSRAMSPGAEHAEDARR